MLVLIACLVDEVVPMSHGLHEDEQKVEGQRGNRGEGQLTGGESGSRGAGREGGKHQRQRGKGRNGGQCCTGAFGVEVDDWNRTPKRG